MTSFVIINKISPSKVVEMSMFKNSLLTSIVVVVLLNIVDVAAQGRCFSNSHCVITSLYDYTTKYCCHGKDSYNSGRRTCQEDCIGYTCEIDSDCGSTAQCCESEKKCRKECVTELSGGIIAAIIIGIIFVIAIPIAIVVCCCCCGAAAASAASRRPVQGGVVLTSQPGVTVVTSQSGQIQAPVYPPPSYPATSYPATSYPPPSYPPLQNYPPPPQNAGFAYPSKPGQDGMFAPAAPMQTQGPPPTYTA